MIRIGIMGYGNLGRGVEYAVAQNPDMQLAAVFTRRDPASIQTVTPDVPVLAADKAAEMQDKIDVMILCGGSATDLPKQTPALARLFNVVDSFDTHARIPEHFAAVDAAAKEGGTLALISAGWDPGLFSLNRVYASAVLPQGFSVQDTAAERVLLDEKGTPVERVTFRREGSERVATAIEHLRFNYRITLEDLP